MQGHCSADNQKHVVIRHGIVTKSFHNKSGKIGDIHEAAHKQTFMATAIQREYWNIGTSSAALQIQGIDLRVQPIITRMSDTR